MVQSFQIALFSATVNLTNKIELVNRINKSLNTLFNGEPLIMPIPENAPLEIPRIVLKNKEEEFSLSISPMRVDLFFNNKKQSAVEFNVLAKQMKSYSEIILKIMSSEFSSSFLRIGIICSQKLKKENPIEYLSSYFNTSKNIVKGKKEIQLHMYETEESKLTKYNNWIRLIAQDYDSKREKLTLINDINSINIDGNILKIDQIGEIFDEVILKMEKNFEMYG